MAPVRTLKAWCAYLNSTPAVLSYLNRRQKKLTYADYSLDQLRSIPVPDPLKVDLGPLADVYEKLCRWELEAWPRMAADPVRAELDDAVVRLLDLDPAEVADWRRRIAAEPTVSNAYAEDWHLRSPSEDGEQRNGRPTVF